MIRSFLCFQFAGSWSSSSPFVQRDFPAGYVLSSFGCWENAGKGKEEIMNPFELFVFWEPEQYEASFILPFLSWPFSKTEPVSIIFYHSSFTDVDRRWKI